MPQFVTPYIERQRNEEHLRYKTRHGLSVYRIGGQWHQKENPSWDDFNAADRFYVGGYIHTITDAEKTDLVAAGYGAYITG